MFSNPLVVAVIVFAIVGIAAYVQWKIATRGSSKAKPEASSKVPLPQQQQPVVARQTTAFPSTLILRCTGCGEPYNIGVDAIMTSWEETSQQHRGAVGQFSSPSPDLVARADLAKIKQANHAAWLEIEASNRDNVARVRGSSNRQWQCQKCQRIQSYSGDTAASSITSATSAPVASAPLRESIAAPAQPGNNPQSDQAITSGKLMWQKLCDGVERTQQEAFDYCSKLSLAGYTDWRLPSMGEFQSLGKNLEPQFHDYWTSSDEPRLQSSVAYINDGTTMFRTNKYFVRAVRSITVHDQSKPPSPVPAPTKVSALAPFEDLLVGATDVTNLGPEKALSKAIELTSSLGRPTRFYSVEPAGDWPKVLLEFSNGRRFKFSDFRTGYHGTGPQFFAHYLQSIGCKLTIDAVVSMKPPCQYDLLNERVVDLAPARQEKPPETRSLRSSIPQANREIIHDTSEEIVLQSPLSHFRKGDIIRYCGVHRAVGESGTIVEVYADGNCAVKWQRDNLLGLYDEMSLSK